VIWKFDVFVSYSRRDSAFVERLVGMLRQAGLEVWLDVEQVPGGAEIQETVLRALEAARSVIAVVSEHWLGSDYATWEIATARAALRDDRFLVPLALQEFDAGRLGPFLHRRNVLVWPPNDPDPDARFWEVFCALHGQGAGPRAEWSARGREKRRSAREGGGSVLSAGTEAERARRDANRARWGPARAALRFDRTPQWKEIEDHAGLPWHEALIVQGEDHESPELFLEAVQQYFPETPPRRIVPILWNHNRPPQTKTAFFTEIARAFGVLGANLPYALGNELREQNLVLVHRPQLAASLRNRALVKYYTEHLPALLSRLQSGGCIKLVQGIAWSGDRLAERHATEAWLRGIRRNQRLPIVLLEPLRPITEQDVDTWSWTLPPHEDRNSVVKKILDGAGNSAEILSRIIGQYGRVEANL
jgi:hypothetical protein